ncbi:hypothetical protein Pcinc_043840, partial [Petrolisthes cinctipes]
EAKGTGGRHGGGGVWVEKVEEEWGVGGEVGGGVGGGKEGGGVGVVCVEKKEEA